MWFQKLSIPPLRKGSAVWPPLPLDFPKSHPQVYPHPLWNFQIFPTSPGNVATSYWRGQIGRFVHWDAKFCEFHAFSVEFYNKCYSEFLMQVPYWLRWLTNLRKVLGHRHEMQDRLGNMTVLFSHCFKKKAALQGSINREIRILSCDKRVRVSNLVLPNSHIWVSGKILFIIELSRKVWHAEKDSCN